MLYNKTNNNHMLMHTYRHGGGGVKMVVKKTDGLEIIIKQVSFEGSFEKESQIRVVEHQRQTVPNRWACARKSFAKSFCVYTRVDNGMGIRHMDDDMDIAIAYE